ncbi:hypothetical protein HO133_004455 [Letharia lupina]|uniref:Flavodoxin-like domain-containing protein n=1 Tax=Letharia lupina TaxID=560253 RepID=A0A8H6KZN9_9LECA|nr:uncharacterized protein HO133_004455 [Letharia lupina]KAF6230116.1 hypothetical protein HO133_004455 [Letharia lupina]
MAPRIAIIYYSMYGHIGKIAEAEKSGIEAAGGKADVYQVKETLPEEVLSKMHAPGQSSSIPFITPDELEKYDAFLLGIPTRYGNFPTQWKAFWDQTGKQWQTGGYYGKYVGVFISTASQGGGQESTALAAMSTFTHHGMIYVPLGYATAFATLANLEEVRGGSPWGAGTFAGADGSRMPTEQELSLAKTHDWSGGVVANTAAAPSSNQQEPVAAVGTTATSGTTGAGNGASDGTKATTVGTNNPDHVNKSEGAPAAEPVAEKKESGPCGLPFKCVIL